MKTKGKGLDREFMILAHNKRVRKAMAKRPTAYSLANQPKFLAIT